MGIFGRKKPKKSSTDIHLDQLEQIAADWLKRSKDTSQEQETAADELKAIAAAIREEINK